MKLTPYQESVRRRQERILILLKENPSITPHEIAVIENGGHVFARGSEAGMISGIRRFIKKLNSEQKDERSVATEGDSSTDAGKII